MGGGSALRVCRGGWQALSRLPTHRGTYGTVLGTPHLCTSVAWVIDIDNRDALFHPSRRQFVLPLPLGARRTRSASLSVDSSLRQSADPVLHWLQPPVLLTSMTIRFGPGMQGGLEVR